MIDRCPLCSGPNRCALATPDSKGEPCWCVGREFPPALLDRSPDRTACICEACLEAVPDEEPAQG